MAGEADENRHENISVEYEPCCRHQQSQPPC
jgi:hypothetical protein